MMQNGIVVLLFRSFWLFLYSKYGYVWDLFVIRAEQHDSIAAQACRPMISQLALSYFLFLGRASNKSLEDVS